MSTAIEVAPCWFCKRVVPVSYLIAGYDTWEEQRLACLDCDAAMVARRFDPDPLRPVETDDIYVEPYVPEKWPVGWDFLAAVVIAAACIAFGWWAFLR